MTQFRCSGACRRHERHVLPPHCHSLPGSSSSNWELDCVAVRAVDQTAQLLTHSRAPKLYASCRLVVSQSREFERGLRFCAGGQEVGKDLRLFQAVGWLGFLDAACLLRDICSDPCLLAGGDRICHCTCHPVLDHCRNRCCFSFRLLVVRVHPAGPEASLKRERPYQGTRTCLMVSLRPPPSLFPCVTGPGSRVSGRIGPGWCGTSYHSSSGNGGILLVAFQSVLHKPWWLCVE